MVDAADRLEDWIGRTEHVGDTLSPWPAQAVAAMLDDLSLSPGANGELPPLWQWFYFLGTLRKAVCHRTAIPSAAASCRRCRCRGECLQARACSSIGRCCSAAQRHGTASFVT